MWNSKLTIGNSNTQAKNRAFFVTSYRNFKKMIRSVFQDLTGNISNAFQDLFRNLIYNDQEINIMINKIGEALQKSDVPEKLVKKVIKNLKAQLFSKDFKKYTNKKKIIKQIVWKEIYNLLNSDAKLYKPIRGKQNVIMFVGLQGSGKTTTIAKYAYYYKRRKWKCALVCADTFRAGAFDQLKQNATKIGVPYYGSHTETDPVKIAFNGVKQFKEDKYELILVDTSGRHKQEKSLFNEMKQIEEAVNPNNIVFILDGTIGQSVLSQSEAFKKMVNIGSCIVTKLDGNTKGGGALAAVAATKSPIIFIGYGEHFTDFEEFDSEGFASRILGFGDTRSIIKQLEVLDIDKKKQKETIQRVLKGMFTLRDLYSMINMFLKVESTGMLNMIPQLKNFLNGEQNLMENLKKYVIIMDSMTNSELDHPKYSELGKQKSRIKRLALGSGITMKNVIEFLGSYKKYKRLFGKLKHLINLKDLENNPGSIKNMMNSLIPGGMKNLGKIQQMMKMGGQKGIKFKRK